MQDLQDVRLSEVSNRDATSDHTGIGAYRYTGWRARCFGDLYATDAPRVMGGSWGGFGRTFANSHGRSDARGSRFPSFYIDPKHYPVRVNELIGAFVDRKGALVSMPFPVGRWVELRVPEGAYAIALGINSDSFSSNSGSFNVLVTDKTPKVFIVPVADGNSGKGN